VLLLTVAPPVGWDRWLVLLTMTGNAVPGSYQGVNTPLLVLMVEVQFYVLLPVLVALLRWRPTLGFAAGVVGALTAASLVTRVAVLQLGLVANPERFVRASVLTMFHLFGAGMLLALLALWMDGPGRRPRGPAGGARAWLLAAVAVWLIMFWTGIEPLSGVFSVLLLGAVVLPLRPSRAVATLAWRPAALVGLTTFSLYMWHVPIAEAVAASWWAPPGLMGYGAVCLALTAAVTVVSYALVEAPALGLRLPWASADPNPDPTPARGRAVVARVLLGAAVIGAVLAALAALRGPIA
jgi:peptidoglycan/LPS O-acetylase OafA/YrhL